MEGAQPQSHPPALLLRLPVDVLGDRPRIAPPASSRWLYATDGVSPSALLWEEFLWCEAKIEFGDVDGIPSGEVGANDADARAGETGKRREEEAGESTVGERRDSWEAERWRREGGRFGEFC